MNSLKQKKQTEAFETVLLSHVDMCYAVALALTHDPDDARNLTREVLEWAWNLLNRADPDRTIKTQLLIMMHTKFIEGYQRTQQSQVKHTRIAERV